MAHEIDSPEPADAEAQDGADGQKSVRDRLIEVAARHFAEHGIQGASQRAIQREVGVNVATANYYFGSKEALYRAVIETALARILPPRQAALHRIPAGLPRRQTTRALMHAYVAPHLRQMTTRAGYYYARMLASLFVVVPHAAAGVVDAHVIETREHYVDALSRLYPHASRVRVREVLRLAVGLMAVSPGWLGHDHMSEDEVERLIADVTETAMASFEALLGENRLD